ncbi:MAG TPA: DEAD/DEAH box helicase, partial [Nakamurella sp.]
MTQNDLISPTIEDPDGAVADAAIDPDDAARSHPLAADAVVRPESPTFAEFGVDERIVRVLADAGIEHTFAIQALTLPIALTGSDLIGQARTGMGKTLGFGVPLLQRLSHDKAVTVDAKGKLPVGRAPRAVVMVPTRELCVQVTRDLHQIGRALGLAVTAVYGGRAYE